jgi:hypothetical protein
VAACGQRAAGGDAGRKSWGLKFKANTFGASEVASLDRVDEVTKERKGRYARRMGQKKMAMNGKNRITNDGGRPVRTSVAVESADYAIAVPGKFCASTA